MYASIHICTHACLYIHTSIPRTYVRMHTCTHMYVHNTQGMLCTLWEGFLTADLQAEASEGVLYNHKHTSTHTSSTSPPASAPTSTFCWGLSHFGIACSLADLAWYKGDVAETAARLEHLQHLSGTRAARVASPLQHARLALQRIMCKRLLQQHATSRGGRGGAGEGDTMERDVALLLRGIVTSGNGHKLSWTSPPGAGAPSAGRDSLSAAAVSDMSTVHVPLTWNELVIQGLCILTERRGGAAYTHADAHAHARLFGAPHVLVMTQVA